jgi:small-conductance mechanosensitive channel
VTEYQALIARAQRTIEPLLLRLRSTEFLLEIFAIVVSGLLAFWVTAVLRRLLARFFAHVTSQPILGGMVQVLASVAVPGLWLILLWTFTEAGAAAGFNMTLASDGVSLLVAWIVIRLMSHVVRHPFWSTVIFLITWSIAALNILGVLNQLEASLDALGFQYGTVRVSALNVVRAVMVLAVLLWLTALIRNFLERRIFSAQSLTPSLQALLVQLLKLTLPALAIFITLPVLGINLTALTVFGGALAVGVGLGLQKTVANLVGGLMLIIGGSIKPGDIVAVKDVAGNETYGRVTSIGARYVSLRTRDGIEYLVPNETFVSEGVENWTLTDNRVRLKIPFGIAYDSDLRQAMALAEEAARAVKRINRTPPPFCVLMGFGDSSVDFELRVWIDDPMNGIHNVKSEVLLQIWDRFKANGITIPFPQRDLHLVSMSQPVQAAITDQAAKRA